MSVVEKFQREDATSDLMVFWVSDLDDGDREGDWHLGNYAILIASTFSKVRALDSY